jgi:hypothetical protein
MAILLKKRGTTMAAVKKEEIRDETSFMRLLDLHADEIRVRDGKIAELSEMLEKQASELIRARQELNACKARLAVAAA